MEENQLEEGERLFTQILTLHPDAAETLLHRGYLRLRMQKLDLASEDLEKFMVLRPENGIGFLIQGEILLERNEALRAYEVLSKAVRLEKDNGRAFYQL